MLIYWRVIFFEIHCRKKGEVRVAPDLQITGSDQQNGYHRRFSHDKPPFLVDVPACSHGLPMIFPWFSQSSLGKTGKLRQGTRSSDGSSGLEAQIVEVVLPFTHKIHLLLPSGYLTVRHGKSPVLIGKPPISMGHLYHGYVSHNQMVNLFFFRVFFWHLRPL
jgi:hypothetical protein